MKQLIVFLLFLLVIIGCNKKQHCEKEIYLLPDGFRGTMIVYFDQTEGSEIQHEGDARVYHIPTSGFLKSQFPKNGGCMNDDRLNFFYLDSLGNRKPVVYFLNLPADSLPKDRDYVLFSFLSNPDHKPDFVVHMVGKFDEFNELTQSMHVLEPVKILESLP